jgi:hypothetical protein
MCHLQAESHSYTHANLTPPYVHNNDLQRGYAPVQIDDKVGTVPTRFLVCLTVSKSLPYVPDISIKKSIYSFRAHISIHCS